MHLSIRCGALLALAGLAGAVIAATGKVAVIPPACANGTVFTIKNNTTSNIQFYPDSQNDFKPALSALSPAGVPVDNQTSTYCGNGIAGSQSVVKVVGGDFDCVYTFTTTSSGNVSIGGSGLCQANDPARLLLLVPNIVRELLTSPPVGEVDAKRRMKGVFVPSLFIFSTLLLYFIFSLNDSIAQLFLSGFNSYDIQRISELILLLIISLTNLLSKKQTDAVTTVVSCIPNTAKKLLLFIFLWGIISSLLAPLPKVALLEVAEYTLLFSTSITIAAQRVIWGNSIEKILLGIIIFSAVYYSLYFIYCYLHLLTHTPDQRMVQFPGFVQLRFFSEFQIWTLAFISLPLFKNFKSGWICKTALILFSIFWWSLVIFNGSKGLWLGCIVAMIAVLFLFRNHAKKFLLIQLIFILLGVIFSFILFLKIPSLLTPETALQQITHDTLHHNVGIVTSSFDDRLILWQQAMHFIVSHPLFGVGPQHFAYYFNEYGAHPHNAVMLFASEWGLPVIAGLLWLVLWGIISWIKNKSTSPLHIALTFTLIAACIDSLTGGLVVSPVSQVMMSIILGWALGNYQSQKLEHTHISSLLQNSIIFILILSCAAIIIFVYPQINLLTENEMRWYFLQSPADSIFRPRFWMQGWLR